jgi:diguanylate cyclase (GGDEF)-like protein
MRKTLRLLFVEDAEDDALLVVRQLRRGHFDVEFQRVDTADALTGALDQQTWDMVISDHSMPRLNGTEALEIVKKSGHDIPFIFVSGTIGEDTAVAAMKAGAHDYVMKGNLKRLVPAVERELREAENRRQRKQSDEGLRYLAYHDVVTALPNYTFFSERLEQAILAAQHDQNQVALLIMKVNGFKEINEMLGQRMAEILLKQVGQRLREELDTAYTPACLQGNEFAALLPSLRDVDEASQAARAILKCLESPFILEGLKLGIQANFGIAYFPQHGKSAEFLIQRARVALSAAQKDHRDYAVYSPEQAQGGVDQLTLIHDLRRAIIESQLFLLYQPKVDLRGGRIVGAEALLRWKHSEFGLITPDRFIPLAERTGLIMPLTLWVLHEALHQCKVWNAENRHLTTAVNLSTWNLIAAELPDQIGGLLDSTKVTPSELTLEITESAIMVNPDLALRNVSRMKNMGLRFSIDDFGTGYSSLAYLSRFPIDEIKIDKSFVMNMTTKREDAVIVRSTIDLGHNLGVKVVAEGVEDRKTLDLLVELGCDAAQGYYFSRPLPAQELLVLLTESGGFLTDGTRTILSPKIDDLEEITCT